MISGNEPADDRQPSRGTAGQLFSCLIWHGTGHQACGPCRDLRPAGEAEPGQDVRHVAGHRWSAQAQAPGDGRIGQDRGHQFRHFDLARGKASASLGVAATPGRPSTAYALRIPRWRRSYDPAIRARSLIGAFAFPILLLAQFPALFGLPNYLIQDPAVHWKLAPHTY